VAGTLLGQYRGNPAIFGHEKFDLNNTYNSEGRRVRPVFY